MPKTCKDINNGDGSWTCAAVYNWTHNDWLAHAADWAIGKPFSILCLIVGALVVRWVLNRVIDRLVARASDGILPSKLARGPFADPGGETSAHRRVQRAVTMGSLLKSVTGGVIFVVVFMMALAEVGVNIAPLIAGAGIVGVALGFGAQSLVKDFLSGIFMIFEDQYGVGDSVTFGDVSGTIEAVSLRVTRVRDVDGTVWYVRNGEILKVGNQSQNWSRTVLDIAVSYKEDVTRVRRILKDVAHQLWEDERYREKIIEEPEVWGVQSLGPDSVVVRVTLKTMPQQQWVVAREMRERVKARFDEEGVITPLPQRILYGDPGKPAGPPPETDQPE
ncbi:mechanosensitive ion channel family protein [Nocardioides marmorisolisilvae]|uniref:Mechanosensitive ion channel family protein n=2 Tax=Nocardioides marmorisolisilvae TaxID=1542737 RepID=A0A3N0DXV8_9ACTN|nr:mechanosensitive ion channel family protein [Nocardioides marmorisolisilvae]